MYCQNCGREIGDSRFCPICGTEQTSVGGGSQEALFESPAYTLEERYRTAFSDPMFLAITVIETVIAVLSFFIGNQKNIRVGNSSISFTLSVPAILFAIALWIIFAAVRSRGRIGTTGFAIASGTLKAMRIVLWVVTILIIVLAVLLIIAGNYVVRELDVDLPEFLNELGIEMRNSGINVPQLGHPDPISGFGAALIAIVAVVLIILLILINVLFLKKLHGFAKSVCVSLRTGTPGFRYVRAARNWLIVSAVFSFISAAAVISGLKDPANALPFISSLLGGVASILASLMIKTHFFDLSEY